MKLLDQQQAGADFLCDRGDAACFDLMGAGKTLIAAQAYRQMERDINEPLVVICPVIARQMWADVVGQHCGIAPRSIQIIRKGDEDVDPTARMIVTSYGLTGVTRLARQLSDIPAAAIVLDESSACKTHDSQRTRAVFGRKLDGSGHAIIAQSRNVWCLDGTPIRRWNDDLYPMIRALWPERLGIKTLAEFRLRFCVMEQTYVGKRKVVKVAGSKNEDELNALLYEGDEAVAIRRQIPVDMPDLTRRTIEVDLVATPALAAAVAEVTVGTDSHADAVARLIDHLESGDTAAASLRRLVGIAKVPGVAQYLCDLIARRIQPVLCFAWHRDVLSQLALALIGLKMTVATIAGDTPERTRLGIIDEFNAGRIDILLGQTSALGVSANLQERCRHVVFAERDWSPAVEEQAIARVYRMGQTGHVQVDTAHADNLIDEAVEVMLERKRGSHARAIG